MKLVATLAPLLLILMTLAGCSSSDGSGGSDGFVTPEKDSEGRYVIKISNFKFTPAKATVPAGSTVVWMLEAGAHNVVPDGHSQWSASSVSTSAGEHLEATLSTAGDFDYYCQPHKGQGMTATIRVK